MNDAHRPRTLPHGGQTPSSERSPPAEGLDVARRGRCCEPLPSARRPARRRVRRRPGEPAGSGDAGVRRELAAWVRPNRTRRLDGTPGYAFFISDLPSMLGPTVIATFDTGARQAKTDERLALTAPALMVLGAVGDVLADAPTSPGTSS